MSLKRFCTAAALGCFAFFSIMGNVKFSDADLSGPCHGIILGVLWAALICLPASIILAILAYSLEE